MQMRMRRRVPTVRGSMMMMNDPAYEPLYDPTQVRSDEELRQQLAALAEPESRLAKRDLAAFAGLDQAQVQALQSVWLSSMQHGGTNACKPCRR